MTTRQSKAKSTAPKGSSKTTSDHDVIRKWAETRNAKPASVKGTGGNNIGVLRLMFPGYSSGRSQSLREISWDEFFRKFDENHLSFIYQDETSSGVKSNFNKFIKRK
jgi:hypothetical protein